MIIIRVIDFHLEGHTRVQSTSLAAHTWECLKVDDSYLETTKMSISTESKWRVRSLVIRFQLLTLASDTDGQRLSIISSRTVIDIDTCVCYCVSLSRVLLQRPLRSSLSSTKPSIQRCILVIKHHVDQFMHLPFFLTLPRMRECNGFRDICWNLFKSFRTLTSHAINDWILLLTQKVTLILNDECASKCICKSQSLPPQPASLSTVSIDTSDSLRGKSHSCTHSSIHQS